MSFRDQLNSYIHQLERRLRLGAMFRGAAILTSVALAAGRLSSPMFLVSRILYTLLPCDS